MSRNHTHVFDEPWYSRLAKGLIPGHSPGVLYGLNQNIANATVETVWEHTGVIVFPSAASTFYISSSSAADVGSVWNAGVLDDSFVESNQVVVLNGQTPVAIGSGDFFRLNSLANISGTASAGDIYVAYEDNHTAGVPNDTTKVLGKIPFLNGESKEILRNAIYTVPAGKTFYSHMINGWMGNAKGATLKINLIPEESIVNPAVQGVPLEISEFPMYQNTFTANNVIPIEVPEKTTIHMKALASANNTLIAINVAHSLVDNAFK